jgi:hypothetical protein
MSYANATYFRRSSPLDQTFSRYMSPPRRSSTYSLSRPVPEDLGFSYRSNFLNSNISMGERRPGIQALINCPQQIHLYQVPTLSLTAITGHGFDTQA